MTIDKAKYLAIKYLSYRPRTVQEVSTYLQRRQYDSQIIEEVITYLKAQSYLDDNQFCQFWIENRSRLNPKGKKALFFELKNKGIASSLIEQNINQNFSPEMELMAAKELAMKKLKILNDNSTNIKDKISAYLYGRGFTQNVIQKIIYEFDLSNSS